MDDPGSPLGTSTSTKPAPTEAAARDGPETEETTRAHLTTATTNTPQASAQANAASTLANPFPSFAPDHTGLPVPRYHVRAPSNALKLDTDVVASSTPTPINTALEPGTLAGHGNESRRQSATAPITIQEGYLRSAWSTASIGSLSPASAFSSPALNALGDLTPLPSPLVMSDSPGPWQRAVPRPRSRGASSASRDDSVLTFSKGMLSPSPSLKKKGFSSLKNAAVEAAAAQTHHKSEASHGRNRSLSEFAPDVLHNVRGHASAASSSRSCSLSQSHQHSDGLSSHSFSPRTHETQQKTLFSPVEPQTISAAHTDVVRDSSFDAKRLLPHSQQLEATALSNATEAGRPLPQQMHREKYLAAQRGLVPAKMPESLPTPPASNASNRSVTDTEEEDTTDNAQHQYLVMRHGPQKIKTLWRPVRQLGQGTFSKVYLATCEKTKAKDPLDESVLDPRKLVAIKVVEHGPAGGADEERVELSLKREVEMLRSVSHPSLVHLQAFDHDDAQALISLTYCPGGDLFDVASEHRDKLTAGLVQRIFAELISAVRYLHQELIVHRDIKLENVLLNMPMSSVALLNDPRSHPYAIATLTDLGLSRRIPAPPESPLLTTRCGSEDYAAPEILLGQPYDGRATDAWALGVVLYTLMEGRLPFDPLPGKATSRSRAAHRIARCDWEWVNFGNEDGEWDADKGREWAGARECVEGLLKKVSRGRKSLDDISKLEWVQQGIQVEGGLQKRLEDEVTMHHAKDDPSQ